MSFIDTHCHIHDSQYPLDAKVVLQEAHAAGVEQMICIGTDEHSSRLAVAFAALHDTTFAAIGVHPHETKEGWKEIFALAGSKKLVAVGEIGLDYYYGHSPRDTQIRALEEQLEFALNQNLPVIFHVRDAFDDFWPIFDNFHGIRGELHSFTDSIANLEAGLARGLLVGVNGISTFTKDTAQKEMFDAIPLKRMLLETDAPFLTPAPFRGRVNEPAFVRHIAEYHASRRGILLNDVAAATTANARALFALS